MANSLRHLLADKQNRIHGGVRQNLHPDAVHDQANGITPLSINGVDARICSLHPLQFIMKVLLDTNVWRYLVDHAGVSPLVQAVRKSSHQICVAPAVVYEAFKTSDPALRARLIGCMALPSWKRLMPEAYWETEEIRAEVRRLRPEWLRPRPDQNLYRRVRYDWIRQKGGFWDRAVHDMDGEAARVENPLLTELAREHAFMAHEESQAVPARWHKDLLTNFKAEFPSPRAGWDGQAVELWRVNACMAFEQALRFENCPYVDWLAGEIDLDLMFFDSASYTRFWLHEVETGHMKRHWLRTAFEFQQRFAKVNPGTPGDSQLGTYLVDVDWMLTADKLLASFAQRCHLEAPFPLARTEPIPAGAKALPAILELLGSA